MADWGYNDQTDMAMTIERTAHRIAELDGNEAVAECGFVWRVREERRYDDDEHQPPDRKKCGNCPWGEDDG